MFFSGDFSDMSFNDDDEDGDGKLVIAEGDDLDIKMEGLGEDGKPEKKQRRKHNRFNGMSEEDVMKRLLPDLILPDLDILIVSIACLCNILVCRMVKDLQLVIRVFTAQS